MKLLLIVLLLVHGVIHFIGTARAFQWIRRPELPDVKSYTRGMLWLITGLLLLTTAMMLKVGFKDWLPIFIIAICCSSVMIISQWKDARVGMLGNLILLGLALMQGATDRFETRYRSDLAAVNITSAPSSIVSESALGSVPAIVARYIRVSGCIGKPVPEYFHVMLSGRIRKKGERRWMKIQAEQYNDLRNGSRFFYLKSSRMGLPVIGYHRMHNGEASMDIRMAAMLPVASQQGLAMDTAETVTFFNDMACMAPATLLDPRIEWLETTDSSANAQFTLNGRTIRAVLVFNKQGMLKDFRSSDRFDVNAGTKLPWSTPLSNPEQVGGYFLNRNAKAIYNYPDGKFVYGEFHIDSVEINPLALH